MRKAAHPWGGIDSSNPRHRRGWWHHHHVISLQIWIISKWHRRQNKEPHQHDRVHLPTQGTKGAKTGRHVRRGRGNLHAQYDQKRLNLIKHDSLSEEIEATIRVKLPPSPQKCLWPRCSSTSSSPQKAHASWRWTSPTFTSWHLCTNLNSFGWNWVTSWTKSVTNISSE